VEKRRRTLGLRLPMPQGGWQKDTASSWFLQSVLGTWTAKGFTAGSDHIWIWLMEHRLHGLGLSCHCSHHHKQIRASNRRTPALKQGSRWLGLHYCCYCQWMSPQLWRWDCLFPLRPCCPCWGSLSWAFGQREGFSFIVSVSIPIGFWLCASPVLVQWTRGDLKIF
jgi:hypothetical protein